MRTTLTALAGALFLVLSTPDARADYMPPSGLAPGTQYQLIFVTADTITATSSDIAVYNNFVTAEAALDPNLPTTNWHVIGSTVTDYAFNNAPSSSAVSVYNTQGQLVDYHY